LYVLLDEHDIAECFKVAVQTRKKITVKFLHTKNFRLDGFKLDSLKIMVNFKGDFFIGLLVSC